MKPPEAVDGLNSCLDGEPDRHPSDSAAQRELEAIMLRRFGDLHPSWQPVDWATAVTELGLAPDWADARPDFVWRADDDGIVLAEAYSRVDQLGAGHKRKIAMDALKLVAIRHALPPGRRLRTLLLFPEELVPKLGLGWFSRSLQIAAEIVTVALTDAERARLKAATDQQALGQARTKRLKP